MNINWPSVIQGLAVPLGIGLTFWLLSKFKSLKPKKEEQEFTPSEADLKEYQGYSLLMLFFTFTSVAIISLSLYYVLCQLADLIVALRQPHDATVRQPQVIFGLPALFSGIVLSHFPIEYLSNTIYEKETHIKFKKIASKHFGVNMDSLTKPFVIGGLLISTLFFVNAVKDTTYLFNEHIELNGFTTLKPIKKPISDLKEIVLTTRLKAPNGNIVGRLKYHLVFKDGFTWDFEAEESKELIRMLQFKTAAPYRETEFL